MIITPPHTQTHTLHTRMDRGELGLRGSQLEGLSRELEFTRRHAVCVLALLHTQYHTLAAHPVPTLLRKQPPVTPASTTTVCVVY
jgi:hypothetical protein